MTLQVHNPCAARLGPPRSSAPRRAGDPGTLPPTRAHEPMLPASPSPSLSVTSCHAAHAVTAHLHSPTTYEPRRVYQESPQCICGGRISHVHRPGGCTSAADDSGLHDHTLVCGQGAADGCGAAATPRHKSRLVFLTPDASASRPVGVPAAGAACVLEET